MAIPKARRRKHATEMSHYRQQSTFRSSRPAKCRVCGKATMGLYVTMMKNGTGVRHVGCPEV